MNRAEVTIGIERVGGRERTNERVRVCVFFTKETGIYTYVKTPFFSNIEAKKDSCKRDHVDVDK